MSKRKKTKQVTVRNWGDLARAARSIGAFGLVTWTVEDLRCRLEKLEIDTDISASEYSDAQLRAWLHHHEETIGEFMAESGGECIDMLFPDNPPKRTRRQRVSHNQNP